MELNNIKGEYNLIINIGYDYEISYQIERKGLKKFSSLFDSIMFKDIDKLNNLIKNKFDNFMNIENLEFQGDINNYYVIKDTKNDCLSLYDFHKTYSKENWINEYNIVRENLNTRINDFYRYISSATSILVIINEDNFDGLCRLKNILKSIAKCDVKILGINYGNKFQEIESKDKNISLAEIIKDLSENEMNNQWDTLLSEVKFKSNVIAFDARALCEKEKTGVGKTAEKIINLCLKDNNKYLFNFFKTKSNIDNMDYLNIYRKDNIFFNVCKWISYKLYVSLSAFIPIPYSALFKEKAQLTQFFYYYVPPFVKGKVVTIIHDMVSMDCPETMSFKTKMLLKLTLKKSCNRADKIITVSEFSKKQIMKHLNIDKNKIEVIQWGVDLNIFNTDYNKEEIYKSCKKYKIDNEYFLYLGTLEPRKNVERLIKAYYLYYTKFKDIPYLVIAGQKGWLYNDIFNTVKELNIEHKVIFTGYVDDEDVPKIISGAKIFVFPSIYEGFGLPPLEAMACGIPVITSNISSLPEVVGDCALLVNPFSVEDISSNLEKLNSDNDLQKELSKKGIEQASKFTWDNCERTLNEIYKSLLI